VWSDLSARILAAADHRRHWDARQTTGTDAAGPAGQAATLFHGGELVDLNTNAHLGEEDLFVLEADEAFGTFLALHLRGLVVTNIESDHLDHYETIERLEAAFGEVAHRVVGPVVACVDDAGARRLMAALPVAVGYGTGEDATWRIAPRARACADSAGRPVRSRCRSQPSHAARNAAEP
jgi:UDP-N-acetylmuramate-alanine ligase